MNDDHRQRRLSNKPRPEPHHGGLLEQLATQSRSTKRQSSDLTCNQSSAAQPLRFHHCDKRLKRSMVAAVGLASTQLPVVSVRMCLNFSPMQNKTASARPDFTCYRVLLICVSMPIVIHPSCSMSAPDICQSEQRLCSRLFWWICLDLTSHYRFTMPQTASLTCPQKVR